MMPLKYGENLVFKLDERLTNDTIHLTELSLCRALLMNDRRYPWLILVPRYNELREIHNLSDEDQCTLIFEVTATARVLEKIFQPEKINVASLGNLVSQLHVHVIARFKEDEAWPGSVWGIGKSQSYSEDEKLRLTNLLVNSLST